MAKQHVHGCKTFAKTKSKSEPKTFALVFQRQTQG